MKKGLRKVVISFSALFLVFALIAPSMSASDALAGTAADSSNMDPDGTSAINHDVFTVEQVDEPADMEPP